MTNIATTKQAEDIFNEAQEKGINPAQLFKERGFDQVGIEVSKEAHKIILSKQEKGETVSDTLSRLLEGAIAV
ncbi:MAG: hypothetical protein COV35_08550 [Alphaproteobacteria bacterium CG11_big_fil_rev_8_21_14_0_20_39_49]|nr:MAG: hypothetical protein COV35_08550 [Alphaproteobacteria bacterium CG11_big_fil_rev_8_21_14_0_20_39_49]